MQRGSDPYCSPSNSAMNAGEFLNQRQRRLRWASLHDQDYYDAYQLQRRSLDLPLQYVKHLPCRSDSNLSLCLERIECPASTSPICSPSYDTASSHASSPHNNPLFHGETRASTITTERSRLLRNSQGHNRTCSSRASSFSAWSAHSSFDLGQRKPGRALFEDVAEEERPRRRSQQGFSVRRTNTVESRKEDSELGETAVRSCLETSPDNSNGPKKTTTEPNHSSEGFERATRGKDFYLPAINEEENISKNARALESSGSQSSTGVDGEHHCKEPEAKVEKERVRTYVPGRSYRSSFIRSYVDNSLQLIRAEKDKEHKRNRLEARTLAWKEAKIARVLTRSKREEENIIAWENKQKAKADKHFERVERKLEEVRTKMQKKIKRVHGKAERRKAAEKAKVEAETARVAALVERIRLTGKLPWRFLFF